MTKVPILYYSAYGHTERMAQAVAEGVREAGAQVDIKRVPELVPDSPRYSRRTATRRGNWAQRRGDRLLRRISRERERAASDG